MNALVPTPAHARPKPPAETADATLYVLTGPTAVGKSETALAWARAFGAEIVSCDALQVYRGMDIGTAKPPPADRLAVAHHCLDLCDAGTPFSVKAYAEAALAAVRDILARGRRVLITGGSGFYLKSFYAPVADDVAVPADVAARVRALEIEGGAPALEAALRALNPEGLGALDVKNPRRLASALGRCWASGRSLADLRAAFAAQKSLFCAYRTRTVLLCRSPESLRERALARAREMVARGLIDEVAALAPKLAKNPTAARAIGYRETLAWLALPANARPAKDALALEIAQHTCALMRKQRTWFRTQIACDKRVDIDTEPPAPETLFD